MTTQRFAYGAVEDVADVEAFGDIVAECFPQSFTPESRKLWPFFDHPDHMRFLRHDGQIVAGLVALPAGQWFGGRSVWSWGIRLVGVGLDFRSLGAGPVLMAEMLREARRQGVAISSLYPATQPLYRSVGYEQAGVNQLFAFEASAVRLRDHQMQLRRFDPDAGIDILQQLYATRARQSNGNMDRVDWFWKRCLQPRLLPKPVVFLAVGSTGPEGYLVYSMTPNGLSLSGYDIFVTDFCVTTAAAARRLVAHLGEHHSMGKKVRFRGAPDAAALFCMPQQHYRVEESIFWMTRLVDVPKALEDRGYHPRAHGTLHLEIDDALLSENSGRCTLTVEDGKAHVEKGGDGSLKIDIRGLAPLYTGHLSPFDLTLTGLAEGSEEALQQAAHLFAGPRSWMPDFF